MSSSQAQLPLLCVVGPTASGKTSLAIQLAQLLDGEVLSADSVQVYRHFDIGSGKPSPDELSQVPHHLISICEPHELLEAQAWAELADAKLAEVEARGKRPIICGGSYLWVRALLYGLAEAPKGDETLRKEHQEFAAQYGRTALHQKLALVDPEAAARLHPNDLLRVSRALEVFELSGRKLSQLQAAHGFQTLRRPALQVGLAWEGQAYDQRLLRRTRGLFEAGWLEEVRQLLAHGYGDTRAMGAVGYRQLKEALQAEPPAQPDQEKLLEEVYRVTRVFARRQRTWLRDRPITWLSPEVLSRPELLQTGEFMAQVHSLEEAETPNLSGELC